MRHPAWTMLWCVGPVFISACSTDGEGSGRAAGAAAQGSAGLMAGHSVGGLGSEAAAGGDLGMAGSLQAGSAGQSMAMSGAGAGSGAGPHFVGRFEQSNLAGPLFAWSGSAIAVRFLGGTVSVTLDDSGNNFFEVVLDAQHSVLAAEPGEKKYLLGSGLGSQPHELLLYRRTEASFGETTFKGFDLPPSAYLPFPTPLTRRLEVIGDSISAGYGNEGDYPCPFEGKTENHYLSYGALAARALQAELATEAWSGRGVLRNYDGMTSGTMPELFPRTLPARPTSSWDFSSFVPDAVVVNLGTNDFAEGDPGAAFQAAYLQFVTVLRGHYPAAHLVLTAGPMLSGASYDLLVAYLKAVLLARSAAGDANLELLEFGSQDATLDGLGCDSHPSLKTHQRMANQLVASLKLELGW